MTGWTPEQIDNANKYGLCIDCRNPREVSRTYDEEGSLIAIGITCPCGFDHDADLQGKWDGSILGRLSA